jgi:Interferon-induced transmembrane protein/GYF domain 2
MKWYYSKNGTQLGPISEADIRGKIASGEVASSDLIWKEGMPDWQPAASVKELAVSVVSPGPSSTPPTLVASPYSTPTYPVHGGPEIPNYLWQSIVVTILCCPPFGIPGIIYAAKVDGLKATGNFPAAAEASAKAKKWSFISLIAWVVVFAIYMGIAIIIGISGAAGAP